MQERRTQGPTVPASSYQQTKAPPVGQASSASPQKPDADQTPGKQLEDAQVELKKEQADVDQHTKRRDSLKATVTLLQKAVNDIQQAAGSYGQALAGLQKDKRDLDDYFDTKSRMVECTLTHDQKAEIDHKVTASDEKVAEQCRLVDESRLKTDQAGEDYATAQTLLEESQREYDGYKTYPKAIQESLQKLKELRKSVDEQGVNGRTDKMYVLLGVMKHLLAHVTIKSEKEYEDGLSDAWNRLNAAKEEVQEMKKAWDDAKAALDKAQKELKGLEDNRTQALLKALDEAVVPKPRPSAA